MKKFLKYLFVGLISWTAVQSPEPVEAATIAVANITVKCPGGFPCNVEDHQPYCKDNNLDGVCDGWAHQQWTAGQAIPQLDAHDVLECGNPTYVGDINFDQTGAPTGIDVDEDTGIVSGTTSVLGDHTITVSCDNGNGTPGSVTLTATVVPAPTGNVYVVESGAPPGGVGTEQSPFDQIADCNNLVEAGDQCLVKNGTYAEQIKPIVGGTSDEHIIYQAYPGHQPVITNVTPAVDLQLGQNYVEVRGFKITGQNSLIAFGSPHPGTINTWVHIVDGEGIIIDDNVMEYATAQSNFDCFDIDGTASYVKVTNNTMTECGTLNSGGSVEKGNLLNIGKNTHHVLVENNTMTRAGHDVIIVNGNHHVIRRNTFNNSWDHIQTGAGARVATFLSEDTTPAPNGYYLVEENIFEGTGYKPWLGGADPFLKLQTEGTIFRKNILRNPVSNVTFGIKLDSCCTDTQIIRHQRIYANDFLVPYGILAQFDTTKTTAPHIHDNEFKNNAVLTSDTTVIGEYFIEAAKQEVGEDKWNDNRFINNSFENSGAQFQSKTDGAETISVATAETNYSDTFGDNVTGSLRVADGGADLTTVTGGCGTSSITVGDAKYFHDGKELITGDQVRIESGALQTITAIDYDTNTLTFGSTVSCSNGDSVNLNYAGAAPDTGVESDVTPGEPGVYYVGTGGNDNNSGLSPDQRWLTLAKATNLPPGSDVFLLAGSVFENQQLIVNWSGNANDLVVIGTYHVSATGTTIFAPDASGRARIDGTYEASCSVARGGTGGCLVNNASAMPVQADKGLVQVEGDYVQLQALQIEDSAGHGIKLETISGTNGHNHFRVFNTKVIGAARAGVYINHGQYARVDASEITETDAGGQFGDQEFTDRMGAIQFADEDLIVPLPSYALVENNRVHKNYGQGIQLGNTEYFVVRANTVGNVGDIPIYCLDCEHGTFEYNVVYGGAPGVPTAAPLRGIMLTTKDTQLAFSTGPNDITIRGNMITNVERGIDLDLTASVEASGAKIENIRIFHNTVVDWRSFGLDIDSTLGAINLGSIEVANNIFTLTTGTPSACTAPTIASIDMHHNFWSANPEADCDGAGDVYGNAQLTGSGWINKVTDATAPTINDFRPQATSSALGIGTPLTTTLYDSTTYPQIADVTVPCDQFDTAQSTLDAACEDRNPTTPDAGALEIQTVTGEFLLTAADYCVATNGSDSNDGHHTSVGGTGCWQTITKVNNTTFAPGSDVYFRAGDVWSNTKLAVDWAGTGDADSQRTIIGAFYEAGGQAFVMIPTNWDNVSTRPRDFIYPMPRPIISGPYLDSCRKNVAFGSPDNKCPYMFDSTYRTTNWQQAVPSTYYDALVDMSGSKYVTIQDLEVRGSSGMCLKTSVKPAKTCLNDDPDCAQTSLIQRNKIHHCAGSAINLVQSTHNVVRYNDIFLTDLAIGDQLPGWRAATGGFRGGSSINVVQCYPCFDLFEANDIHDAWGENMGLYGIAAAYNGLILARGNYMSNGHAVGLNIGATQDMVLEQNILAGDVSDTQGPNDPVAIALGRCDGVVFGGCGPAFWGYGHENDNSILNSQTPGARIMRRNSVIAQKQASSLHAYSLSTRGLDNQKLEQWDFGNTIFVTGGEALHYQIAGASPIRIVNMENSSNLYIAPAGSCDTDHGSNASKVHLSFNFWTSLQTNTQCRGTNDTISTNTGLDSSDWGSFSYANFPDEDEFLPQVTSAAVGKGNPALATTNYMNDSTGTRNVWWQSVLSKRRWLPECNTTGQQVSFNDWIKGLKTDYCDNPRTTLTIGAREVANLGAAMPATAYCVDTTRPDNSGNGHWPNCKKTVAGLSGILSQTGVQIYFRENQTWNEQLTIATQGSASNRSVIGAFKVVNGQPFIGLSDDGDILNTASTDWGTRPKFQGTYVGACRPDCSWSNDGTPQVPPALPANRNTALVRADNATYTTIQDLLVKDSAGGCFKLDAPSSFSITNPKQNVNVEFLRVVADGCADHGIATHDATHTTIRNSRTNLTGLEWADGKMTNWPHSIVLSRARDMWGLIEGNTVTNSYGEGVGLGGGSYGVIRGNKIAQTRRIQIYSAQFAWGVFEQNEAVGGAIVDANCRNSAPCTTSFSYPIDCINFTHEEDGQPASGDEALNNLARNNLCVVNPINGTDPRAAGIGNAQNDPDIQRVGGHMVGNVLVAPNAASSFLDINTSLTTGSGKVLDFDFAGNLMAGSGDCGVPVNTEFSLYQNMWPTQPADTECRGTGDVNSATTNFLTAFTFSGASATNFPPYTAFQPSTGSAALNVGPVLNTTFLTDPLWPDMKDRFQWLSECQTVLPADADWLKENALNYCGDLRDGTPNIGAF